MAKFPPVFFRVLTRMRMTRIPALLRYSTALMSHTIPKGFLSENLGCLVLKLPGSEGVQPAFDGQTSAEPSPPGGACDCLGGPGGIVRLGWGHVISSGPVMKLSGNMWYCTRSSQPGNLHRWRNPDEHLVVSSSGMPVRHKINL